MCCFNAQYKALAIIEKSFNELPPKVQEIVAKVLHRKRKESLDRSCERVRFLFLTGIASGMAVPAPAAGGEVMLHFNGNPECPLRTHQLHVSEAETEDEFRELRAEFPDDYCSACAPGKGRTDSDRYAELRKLVEAWQSAYHQNDKAQTKDHPITEGWLKHWLHFCDTQKPLLDWSHR